ncbi:hypothetical protein SISNIDRAFT_469037 [Sistotremastrum niveocremeum HHB9708]|uniref:Uncharacterized protein n=1 Tax=Sistotremastrum niveocremeum HHB9708 TaxID=1314777 RepID=A0A164QLT5_9AGAM|nr:hypothetical protein SISNIDRAFT_469037 [Sistotremastrum niveocremeum HHB9708]
MILMEGDTVSAYQYLEHLSGLEYLWERQRILCEFVTTFRYLHDNNGSWIGGLGDIVLSKKHNRLRIGGLGIIDGRRDESHSRIFTAELQIFSGTPQCPLTHMPNISRAQGYSRELNEGKTAKNARLILNELRWGAKNEKIEKTLTGDKPVCGEIGWVESESTDSPVWHRIPLDYQRSTAHYDTVGSLEQNDELRWVKGIRIGSYIRRVLKPLIIPELKLIFYITVQMGI